MPFDPSFCAPIFGPRFLDPDFWILIFESRFLDPDFWIYIFGSWFLDPDFWILIFGSWFLDPGFWTLIFGPRFLDTDLGTSNFWSGENKVDYQFGVRSHFFHEDESPFFEIVKVFSEKCEWQLKLKQRGRLEHAKYRLNVEWTGSWQLNWWCYKQGMKASSMCWQSSVWKIL